MEQTKSEETEARSTTKTVLMRDVFLAGWQACRASRSPESGESAEAAWKVYAKEIGFPNG